MQLTQLIAITKVCLLSRHSSPLLLIGSLVVFALGVYGRYDGQHAHEAVLVQLLTLCYFWGIYIGHCLPQLIQLRNNKNFQLIQAQKSLCYWVTLATSTLVATLTLIFLMPFGQFGLTNTLLILLTSFIAWDSNRASITAELSRICQPIFALALITNSLYWLAQFEFVNSRWLAALAIITSCFYGWVIKANYRAWLNRSHSGAAGDSPSGVTPPYQRRKHSTHK